VLILRVPRQKVGNTAVPEPIMDDAAAREMIETIRDARMAVAGYGEFRLANRLAEVEEVLEQEQCEE
jgi:hypothetical protein